MATPQPSTPGDRREDYAQQVAATVAAVFAQAELVVLATIATLAKRVAAGGLLPAVAGRRLSQTSSAVFGAAMQRAAATYGPAWEAPGPSLEAAVQTASAAAEDALTAAVTAAAIPPSTGVAAPVVAVSPFRAAVGQAIASSRGGLPATSLSLSRVQAAQKALDDLAARGLTGFVDKAGRRWDLVSYVEMATRTAVSNAWDEHQAAALIRAGIDLVLVGTHSTEGSCPRCLPWLGRTLSLAGATPDYPTLADARAAGFRHPNCRCSWAPIGADIAAEVTNPVDVERAAAAYAASQRQRALERRVRAAHRRTATAATPATRAKARRDLRAAQTAADQHRQRSGVVMTNASARRRQHPFHAR
jgi:hypothetical protein